MFFAKRAARERAPLLSTSQSVSGYLGATEIVDAVHGSPTCLGEAAFDAAAHCYRGFSRQRNIVHDPRRLFVKAFWAQAAFIWNAGIASKDVPDQRLLLRRKLLYVSLLAGVQRLEDGGAGLDEFALASVVAGAWH